MPKQKTRKAVAKRVRKTGTGKFKRKAAGRGHLLTCKSSKRKRQLRKGALVSKSDMKRVASQIAG